MSNKFLNTLFEVGGSRLYKTVEDAENELVKVGFIKEENGSYRLYPDELDVDEDFQSGWVQAEIRLMRVLSECQYNYFITFEFMV